MRVAAIAIALTIATGAVCAVLGAFIGWIIGMAAPSYYRAMFPRLVDQPGMSPVEFGLGAGLAQGATMGFIVGGLLVAVALIVQRKRS
ncbi:MAG: hypothetical protein QM770_10590 [Tepidisphaeraceae bacterium]